MSEPTEQVGTPPVLEVEDLHGAYLSGTHAVKGVSFTINKGGCLGVVSKSGSGKPTLAKYLLTLEPTSTGRATLEGELPLQHRGKGLRNIRRHLRVVFQNPANSFNSRLTMYDSLLEPLHTRGLVFPSFVQPGTQREVAEQLVDLVCLPVSYLDRKPHELDGDEKQRVTTAQAINVKPTLLIFDKPTVSLDVSIQARVLNLLQESKEELGLSSMFISHDSSAVRFMSERSIVLRGEEIANRFGHDELSEDGRDQYAKGPIKLFED